MGASRVVAARPQLRDELAAALVALVGQPSWRAVAPSAEPAPDDESATGEATSPPE